MIGNVKSTEGIGDNVLKKTIHAGSESIMFSVLQETQYMYPFKSSVREIVSNSIDSVNERNNALKILDDEIQVSDLFIEKEGTEFADSRFDREYYDKKWLSDDDEVIIRYIENDTKSRDRIQFIDHGVALGGSRLVNYFSLGFSTKRLSKSQLGNFGLGAKSLLATGVDMYSMTTRYNGKEFSFNVFKDHVISSVDKFNEDGSINEEYEFYNGYKCYFRKTKKKNKVVVESEVKRHRKQDYFGGIQNQLGYIDNIKFVVFDKNYPSYGDAARDIKSTVVFKTDDIIVGDRNYYAVPQILLKPGKDSPIKINYGPINFDELEMKKYTGNVGFVMNINDVDVTPSRESVIWNTKTRDAIKNMFLTAQQAITDIISKKLVTTDNLPDHTYMLNSMKNKGSSDSMAELYKVIDVSAVDVKYKGFNISQAALQLNDNAIKSSFIFTSTKVIGGYYAKKVEDSSFNSALSKEYISKLSQHNSDKDVMVYIGDTKSKGLGRYIKDIKSLTHNDSIEFVYVRPSIMTEYATSIKIAGGTEKYLEEMYVKGQYKNVLIAEIIRYTEKYPGMVLFEKDVDKTRMTNLVKEEEESTTHRYMSDAQKAKMAGKVIGRKHSTREHTYQVYYDETKAVSDNIIIYDTNNPRACSIIGGSSYASIPDDIHLVGFSKENYKRFYKVKGIRLLPETLFTIEFGDLKFTKLGKFLLSSSVKLSITNRYIDTDKNPLILKHEWASFLDAQFVKYEDDKELLIESVLTGVDKIKSMRMDYLLEGNRYTGCAHWKCPSNMDK
jgi:hypothetical protein